ncbi:unnamed protein product [Nippostrongylus brasiliensis]|uniref:Secreted protein n=1 Tax=Nippostrongylus brasiliensis TaxID=27835 RepID=A0A0N4YAN1_NIPBR|nr:hypothetical protein Q1695_015980 [Nippostrongylus brasiliensis]VDL77050.1 unnamed protein product [Nippostrongylus brasiliensis]
MFSASFILSAIITLLRYYAARDASASNRRSYLPGPGRYNYNYNHRPDFSPNWYYDDRPLDFSPNRYDDDDDSPDFSRNMYDDDDDSPDFSRNMDDDYNDFHYNHYNRRRRAAKQFSASKFKRMLASA